MNYYLSFVKNYRFLINQNAPKSKKKNCTRTHVVTIHFAKEKSQRG